MATIVNTTPTSTDHESSGFGYMMGAAFLIIAFLLFFLVALPTLRGAANRTPAPAENSGGTNIQVPERIDVNVNDGQQ